jgi:nucleotide-binding universal stress UspA family protein
LAGDFNQLTDALEQETVMLAIKTILHPTDFSEYSQAAFEVARAVARDYRARLILLHVSLPIMQSGEVYALITHPDEIREELTNRLKAMRSMSDDVAIEIVLKEGDPATQILTTCKEMGCDLIVMGTHGRTGLSHLLTGSVAEKVIRNAACPALTIKNPIVQATATADDAAPVETILHPTDFSADAQPAFEVACALAGERRARLVVLHVERPPLTSLGGTTLVPPLPSEYDRERLWDQLNRIQPSRPGIDVEHRLEYGDPEAVILQTAHEIGADLIVMGTHGRTGLRRLLMGSVAEHVVRKASCSVLTVRTPLAAFSTPSLVGEETARA